MTERDKMLAGDRYDRFDLELVAARERARDLSAGISRHTRIGSRTVIRAGNIVTRDLPEQVFAAGNPCQVIRPLEQHDAVP
jgi:hypothetical protein